MTVELVCEIICLQAEGNCEHPLQPRIEALQRAVIGFEGFVEPRDDIGPDIGLVGKCRFRATVIFIIGSVERSVDKAFAQISRCLFASGRAVVLRGEWRVAPV